MRDLVSPLTTLAFLFRNVGAPPDPTHGDSKPRNLVAAE